MMSYRLLLPALCLSSLCAVADEAQVPPASETVAQEQAQEEQAQAATAKEEPMQMNLQFQLAKNAPQVLDWQKLSTSPFAVFMDLVQQSFTHAKANQGNAQAQLQVQSNAKDSILKEIPPVLIATKVLSDNQGETTLSMNPLVQDITDGTRTGKISWQGLNGKITYPDTFAQTKASLEVPTWMLKIDNEAEVSLGKFTLSSELDADFAPLQANVAAQSFSVIFPEASQGKLTLAHVGIKFDLTAQPSGFKTGLSETSLEQLVIDRGEEGKLSLDKLSLSAETKAQEGNVALTVKLGLDKAQLPAAMMHSALLRKLDFGLTLALLNLDEQVLADVQKTFNTMRKQGLSEVMIMMSLMGKLTEAAPRILQRSPAIELSQLQLKTDQGTATGSITVRLDGEKYKGDGKQPVVFSDPELLKSALSGKASFYLPKAVLAQVYAQKIHQDMAQAAQALPKKDANGKDLPAQAEPTAEQIAQLVDNELKALQAQKFIVPEGEGFRSDIQFEQGKLLVNGQEQPLLF